MNDDAVLIEREECVAIVTLNRPERLNALDLEMRRALSRAFTKLSGDDSVRVIIVAGCEKAFAAGADLKLLSDKNPSGVRELGFADLWRPIADCRKPVIAAVAGYAFGAGCELALMCDIIIVDSSARLGQPEIRVGIMPGAGGSQRLVRVLGKHVTSLMLMTGDPVSGERAAQLGLASLIVPDGEVLSQAKEVARKIGSMPPLALAAIKRTLEVGAELPLAAAQALENREFLLLFDTQDQKEGMTAFLEKRSPQFKGK